MVARILLLFSFFILTNRNLLAVDFRPGMIVPGVKAGYIFGAGISIGGEITYSPIVFEAMNAKHATGAYASLTWFHSKGEMYTQTWYKTMSAGAVLWSDNSLMIRAGVGKSILKWGRNGMNKTKSKSVTPELDLSYSPFNKGEYFGYRIFFPGNACFGLDISSAHEVYTSFRYNFDRVVFNDPEFHSL